jgi:hypothetical protein
VLVHDQRAKHVERPERSYMANNAVPVVLALLSHGALVAYVILVRG